MTQNLELYRTMKFSIMISAEPNPVSVSLSRERSWLSFNRRVLTQAMRQDFPLLERLRFIAIFANNLDEFFTARVQPLRVLARKTSDGGEHNEYLHLLMLAREDLLEAHRSLGKLLHDLKSEEIVLLEPADLRADEVAYFGAFLAERVAPLTDVIPWNGLGDLSSRAVYLAAGRERLEYLVRVPEGIPRILPIPGRYGRFVRLESLMISRTDLFLPEPLPAFAMRLTRGANIELRGAQDWDDLAHALESRIDGIPVRLEVEQGFPWWELIRNTLNLWSAEVFELPAPLDLRCLESLANLERPALRFEPVAPRTNPTFAQNSFTILKREDVGLYHPLDGFEAVQEFVQAAANDTAVDRIRATFYRLGDRNAIADGLIAAARAGKDVAVFLEGRARFDELANLDWKLRLSDAGVRVLPYPSDLKVQYVHRAGRGFVHLATGNYNPVTARLYTDLSVFSGDETITTDAAEFFSALEAQRPPDKLRLMRVGLFARDAMIERIDGEAHAKGHVILKLNHLTDDAVLDALERAANAGARVDLIIRSTLTRLHPKFRVRSLIGRYLEHARIAAFKRGGNWEVWAGSADWMPRNFERRIELLFPLLSVSLRHRVIAMLKAQLEDDRNAFELRTDGVQRERWYGEQDSQTFKF
jgi:polyphosphate kinase